MVAKMTSEQIDAKKAQLAVMRTEELEAMPVESKEDKLTLRKLAVGLIPQASKLKRYDLLAGLKALKNELTEVTKTAETIDTEVTETAETVEPKIDNSELIGNAELAEYCECVHKKFIQICDNSLDEDGNLNPEIHADLSDLAYQLFRNIDERQNRDGNNISATHKTALRTDAIKIIDLQQEKLLKNSKGSLIYNTYKSALPIFYARLNKHFNDISARKKAVGKENQSARRKVSTALDFSPIYDFALSRLSNLEKLQTKEWVDVSTALAIVTGRRLSEIHHTDTRFELVTDNDIAVIKKDLAKLPELDKYRQKVNQDVKLTLNDATEKIVNWIADNFTGGNFNAVFYQQYVKDLLGLSDSEFKKKFVKFTGQQKVSGKKSESKVNLVEQYYDLYPSYYIPVMVSPELVVKAHNWLIENNKVCDESDIYDARKLRGNNATLKPKESLHTISKGDIPHRRYSGDLAKYLKIWRDKIGISQQYQTEKLTKEVFTYKSLRAMYANVFSSIFGIDESQSKSSAILLLAAILGHSRADAMMGRALTDTDTPQSYASDFAVKGYEGIWQLC